MRGADPRGDPADNELFCAIVAVVNRLLICRGHKAAPEQVADGAADALLRYLAHPRHCKDDQGLSLLELLANEAFGRVSNRVRAERRRRAHQTDLSEATWDAIVSPTAAPDAALLSKEREEACREVLKRMERKFGGRKDWPAFRAFLEGGETPQDYAELLGISRLPMGEQRARTRLARNSQAHAARRWARRHAAWVQARLRGSA